jgi:hypothetical protein
VRLFLHRSTPAKRKGRPGEHFPQNLCKPPSHPLQKRPNGVYYAVAEAVENFSTERLKTGVSRFMPNHPQLLFSACFDKAS